MAMEFFSGAMEEDIKGYGKMESSMGREF